MPPKHAKHLQTTWIEEVIGTAPTQWDMLMELLGLLPYQDVDMSLDEVRALILLVNSQHAQELHDIPWVIIEKLMRMDHRCRDNSTTRLVIDKNKKEGAAKEQCIPWMCSFSFLQVVICCCVRF